MLRKFYILEKARIAVIEKCNYRCLYCRPGGDGLNEGIRCSKQITSEEVLKIGEILNLIGCKQINITGGEPFIRKDINSIISGLLAKTSCVVKVNTNASIWRPISVPVGQRQRLEFVISCDTLEPSASRKIGREDSNIKVPLFVSKCLHLNYKVRINCVIVRGVNDDADTLRSFISYFCQLKIPIKFQSVFNTGEDSFVDYDSTYTDLTYIREFLSASGYKIGGIQNQSNGVSEILYSKAGHNIRILDKNEKDTIYFPICKRCKFFPCDTGMYAHYISSSGKMKICRTRDDMLIDIRMLLYQFSHLSPLDLSKYVEFQMVSKNYQTNELPHSF